jgi:hypothetical protein
MGMYPVYLLFDDWCAAAGSVVLLRQVLLEHALAEVWVVPGNFLAFNPGLGV